MSDLAEVKTKTGKIVSNLLAELSDGKISVSEDKFDASFDEVGVDSVLLLTLIVGIEDAFGMDWEDDTPESVFFSIGSIARFLDNK